LLTLAGHSLDEKSRYADAVLARLPNIEMMVPRLWHLEIANFLLVGERRLRCTQADMTTWLAYLAGLPVIVDVGSEYRAWFGTIGLARQHTLSAYDSAYLELALRQGVSPATLDAPLRAAANAVEASIFQP
jgi:predicted nucleic acid-binding protein